MSDTTTDSRTGAQRIADERARQITVEGYTAEHDARHNREHDLQLVRAAMAYLTFGPHDPLAPPGQWPWADADWKPSSDDRVRELEKAGALIAAEIDRLLAVEVSADE